MADLPRGKQIPASLFSVLVIFLLSGCAVTGSSSYQYSLEVAELFEQPALIEDHTYYFLGSEQNPDAVIALSNQYTMNSKVWGKADIDRKTLENWAFQFRTYIGWWNCPYRGVKLFTPDGSQVGVGYSKWTFTVIRAKGPGEIVVYPPQPIGSCKRQEWIDDR